ncbi:MAG: hypothetical protein M3Z01_07470 [Thermoproteota archaeon]|nr:hypothetical protein [Thermoproteota archaeon]
MNLAFEIQFIINLFQHFINLANCSYCSDDGAAAAAELNLKIIYVM